MAGNLRFLGGLKFLQQPLSKIAFCLVPKKYRHIGSDPNLVTLFSYNSPSSSLRTSISCIVFLYLSSIVNSVFSAMKSQEVDNNEQTLKQLELEM